MPYFIKIGGTAYCRHFLQNLNVSECKYCADNAMQGLDKYLERTGLQNEHADVFSEMTYS